MGHQCRGAAIRWHRTASALIVTMLSACSCSAEAVNRITEAVDDCKEYDEWKRTSSKPGISLPVDVRQLDSYVPGLHKSVLKSSCIPYRSSLHKPDQHQPRDDVLDQCKYGAVDDSDMSVQKSISLVYKNLNLAGLCRHCTRGDRCPQHGQLQGSIWAQAVTERPRQLPT